MNRLIVYFISIPYWLMYIHSRVKYLYEVLQFSCEEVDQITVIWELSVLYDWFVSLNFSELVALLVKVSLLGLCHAKRLKFEPLLWPSIFYVLYQFACLFCLLVLPTEYVKKGLPPFNIIKKTSKQQVKN